MGNRTIIKKVCPTCNASGGGCGTCGGAGYLDEYIEDGKYYALCPSCYGGRVYNGQFGCSTCGGSGYKWTYVDQPRSTSSSRSTSDDDREGCLAIIMMVVGLTILMVFAAILFFTPLLAFVLAPIFLILELSGVWGKDVDGNSLDPKRFFTTVEFALLYAIGGAFLIWRYGSGSYTGFTEGIGYAAWVADFDLFGHGAMFPSDWVLFAVSSYANSWKLGLIALVALFASKVVLRIPRQGERKQKQHGEETDEYAQIDAQIEKMLRSTPMPPPETADDTHINQEKKDEPVYQEKSERKPEPRFDVFLVGAGSASEGKLQHTICGISGASPADASYVLKHLPEAVLTGVRRKVAEQALAELTEIGAVAEIIIGTVKT